MHKQPTPNATTLIKVSPFVASMSETHDKLHARYIHIASDAKTDSPHIADPSHTICKTCAPQSTKFPRNYISTNKYNVISFIPLNLIEQFQKKANFYFLIIAILSTTSLSPKTPLVSVAPLVLILAVTAIKEAIEDWARYKMDKEINNKSVRVWNKSRNEFVTVTWQHVAVGDILYITDGQAFPADIAILKASTQQGSCTIETSNLDGETNLKVKQAIPETYNIPCHADGLDYPSHLPQCVIESSAPNKKLDTGSWKANVTFARGGGNGTLSGSAAAGEKLPLGVSQLLLRGCTLRNTRWVVGFVVFTGKDTKLMLNNKAPVFKRSSIERMVDRSLYVLFTLQACLCSFGAVANYIWLDNHRLKHFYLPYIQPNNDPSYSTEAGLSWFTYLVLLDILVPISLYVSMELVKFTQAFYINRDLDMYYELYDMPARARTSNLNEELGQVQYIFSDKTGTLTSNIMNFTCCSIHGQAYGGVESSSINGHHGSTSSNSSSGSGHDSDHKGSDAAVPVPGNLPPPDPNFPFRDSSLLKNLISQSSSARAINEFMTLLATCHTVIADYPGCGTDHIHRHQDCVVPVTYQAASPDEKALVLAAKNNQYYFYHREPQAFTFGDLHVNGERMLINILGTEHEFQLLEIFPFTSDRARMSVIILDPRDGQIKLFSKGSDQKLYKVMNKESKDAIWPRTDQHLAHYGRLGLRTLCCAYRTIPRGEFVDWMTKHKIAKSSIADRETLVKMSEEALERDLTLLGATAIEDKLQDGVPETIQKLADAGIKLWMLTGDKVETAINIGRSCRLLTPKMDRKLITLQIPDKATEREGRDLTWQMLTDHYNELKDAPESNDDRAIVISGRCLDFVFPARKKDPRSGKDILPPKAELDKENAMKDKFMHCCTRCKAVICCRVSPLQKADVVSLAKARMPNAVTLAIGDGANDVSMIKSAHVGVGIQGLEGLQAVMAADYAIAQFRFLETLLLVHGQWSYRRISLLILYSFYKNIIIAMTQIWFAFQSAFSAQMYYDPFAGSAFNLIFTALPVMFAAVFNRDAKKSTYLLYPELYKDGQTNSQYNLSLLGYNMFEAICHSLVLYYISATWYTDVVGSDGTQNDVWVASSAMYTWLVVLVNFKISLLTTTWPAISKWFLFLSILAWFVFAAVYNVIDITPNYDHVAFRMFGLASHWLFSILVPIACLIPSFTYRYIQKMYYPRLVDIVAEIDYFGLEHPKRPPADQDAGSEMKVASIDGRGQSAATIVDSNGNRRGSGTAIAVVGRLTPAASHDESSNSRGHGHSHGSNNITSPSHVAPAISVLPTSSASSSPLPPPSQSTHATHNGHRGSLSGAPNVTHHTRNDTKDNLAAHSREPSGHTRSREPSQLVISANGSGVTISGLTGHNGGSIINGTTSTGISGSGSGVATSDTNGHERQSSHHQRLDNVKLLSDGDGLAHSDHHHVSGTPSDQVDERDSSTQPVMELADFRTKGHAHVAQRSIDGDHDTTH